MKPIPEIVKEFVLKEKGRMPETDKEIDEYLDLINHAKEYADAVNLQWHIGKRAMKKWGLKTPEEIKKQGIKQPPHKRTNNHGKNIDRIRKG